MIRVAIAGCHRQVLRKPTSHNFAAAFCAHPDAEVVGVFDYGERERAEFVECWRDVWGEVPAFDDYEQLLEEATPDIVCIATRQTMHGDQIEKAVAAGVRGILSDKPLATTLAEMDRIVAACAETPLAFALDRRWDSAYRALSSAIAGGLIGEATSLVAYGIPNTINHGCHWYDAVLALLGDPEPAWVSGFVHPGDSADERRRMDPPCRAQIGMDNGAVAYVTCDGPKGPAFEIAGAGGRISVFADASAARIWRDGSEESFPLPPKEEGWPAGMNMVNDLVRAVKEGGRTACDISEARRATEIGFAICSSSEREGVRVALPAADRALRVESFPWGNEAPNAV